MYIKVELLLSDASITSFQTYESDASIATFGTCKYDAGMATKARRTTTNKEKMVIQASQLNRL